MITGSLLNLFTGIISFFLNGMSTTPIFPTEFASSLQTIWGYITVWSYILPVTTFLSVLFLSLIFQSGFWGWRGIKWIIHIIRGA